MENYTCSPKGIVVGTAGIRKSLFRFYLIWKWLKGDQDIFGIFKDIRFNFGNNFFLVQREETVLKISGGQSPPVLQNHQFFLIRALL